MTPIIDTLRSMIRFFSRLFVAVLVTGPLSLPAIADTACGSEDGVALQVLGSGGPFGHGRASSGYLVWVDGVARILVDAGGGTFTRFHEADAHIADLDVIALSHFHPDHSAEVPALLWIKSTELRYELLNRIGRPGTNRRSVFSCYQIATR